MSRDVGNFLGASVEDESEQYNGTGGKDWNGDTKMPDNPPDDKEKETKRDRWTGDLYKAVKRINQLPPDDYYGFLGLSKTCVASDIKPQYRKFAKLVHTDKNSWPDAKKAFQRISQAYQVLNNVTERKKYDRQNQGGYTPLNFDADNLYQEEFKDNAFGGSDSGSESDTDHDDGDAKRKIKPNDAHKEIYNKATPIIQKVLSISLNTEADRKANAEQIKAINNEIKEQNKKDGLEDEFQCQIDYVPFESTAILAAPHVEKLKKNPEDLNAKEWIEYHDSSLNMINRKHGYPNIWTLESSIIAKSKPGKASQKDRPANKQKSQPANKPKSQPTNKQNRQPAKNQKDSSTADTGTKRTKDQKSDAEGSIHSEGMAVWKPGYTLHGEKIIAYIPRERTVHKMVKGVRQPAEKITVGYQFIVKNEDEETIALISGGELGQEATQGYLGLPEEEIRDARYSEERNTMHATLYATYGLKRLVDFASNPFKTRSSSEPRHPPGYGLVEFKNGSQHVLTRSGMRNILGPTDADWKIQECEKKHNRIPAWKIQPLGWREPRQLTIESPSKRVQRQRQIRNVDSELSDSDTLFVSRKKPGGSTRNTSGSARDRGRRISRRSPGHESRAVSRSSYASSANHASRSSQSEEVEVLRNELAELKQLLHDLNVGHE